jgi:hypothetical protein
MPLPSIRLRLSLSFLIVPPPLIVPLSCHLMAGSHIIYQHIVHNCNKKGSYSEFFGSLADELINNTQGIHMTKTALKNQVAEAMKAAKPPTLSWTICLKKRKETWGVKEGVSQGWCRLKGCKVYLSHVCSKCTHPSDPQQKQLWFCNHTARGGSECWKEHLQAVHKIGV